MALNAARADVWTGPEDAPPLLGVSRSLSGRRWSLAAVEDHLTAAMARSHGLPEIVARLLVARGIAPGEVPGFLAPRLRDQLPDPMALKDMRRGAERLAAAIQHGERIVVFGDYDVDGATATALLLRFLRAVGVDGGLYVPDRQREGYGPNTEAMLGLRRNGAALVVTVDCGITAHAPIAAARDAGLDVIVVDHHQSGEQLPPAVAVINPNRRDEGGGLGHLAAVGVAFLLVIDTNRLLRQAGWYQGRSEPDLMQWLDLVALGTVCDMVPLTGLNRAFVAQGLRVLAQGHNPGLRAVLQSPQRRRPPVAADLGFAVGPRINAGGRVGESDLGARLLSTDDPAEASLLAGRLDQHNRERQAIERSVLSGALANLAKGDDGVPLAWAEGEGWHSGVIGIVASRLVERLHRPAVVVSLDGDKAVGSGRSVPGVDLGAIINAAGSTGLLIKGGGHAMAAGFTVARAQLEAFHAFLSSAIDADGPAGAAPVLAIDGLLSLAGAAGLAPELLSALAPYGQGHPEPRFVLTAVQVAQLSPFGDQHLRLSLADGMGTRLPAVAFRCTETPLGRALRTHAGAPFHLAGRLQADPLHGRLQFLIDDAAQAF